MRKKSERLSSRGKTNLEEMRGKEHFDKNFVLILLIILIINTPFILYLSSFRLIAFNENFYKKEFLRYGIHDKFDEDIDQINSDVLFYLKHGKDELVDIDMFNQKEKEHLRDVKELVQKSLIFLNMVIILSVILITILFLANKKKFISNISLVFIFGGIITFLDALIFFILTKTNFELIFRLFHKLFFKAGTWLFSSTDKIIMLYQGEIFYDIVLRIVLATLIMAAVLIVLGLKIDKKKLVKTKNSDFPKHLYII